MDVKSDLQKEGSMKKYGAEFFDITVGRLFLRSIALVAFTASAASGLFGAVVLVRGHFAGLLSLLLGALFLWLGRRAWNDPATLGELLNRDYQKTPMKGRHR